MKLRTLIKRLQAIEEMGVGDVDVLLCDHDSTMLGVRGVEYHVAEEDEFPEDWDIPKGLKFVSINS